MTPSSPAPARRPTRPDESMSLLVDIATQALDPSYAAAAHRRQGSGVAARPARGWLVLGGVLAATLIIVVAGLQAHRRAPDAARSRVALIAQVERRTEAVAGMQDRLDALRRSTTRLRTQTLASSRAGAALSARLSTLELVAGTVAATGPGLRVVLDDAPGEGGGDNRVLDRDVQAVVNALWAAGAEAVAVGPQRLTGQSAIRQAGDAILVNFEPVAPPYVITALGDPVDIETSFAASRAAGRMRTLSQVYGLRFRYSRSDSLTVASAPGLPLRHAVAASSRSAGAGA